VREGAIAVQTRLRPENYHGAGTGSKPVVQHRGTICLGATIPIAIGMSWYRNLVEGRCAYPGLRPAETLLEAGLKRKNRDEFINATVRVRFSALLIKVGFCLLNV